MSQNISITMRRFLLLGAASLCLAVLLGAFGAHALRGRIPGDLLAVYQTGNQYHFYHGLGLLLVGNLGLHWPGSRCLRWSGWLLCFGLVVFSGSLYLLSLTGLRWLGAITPVGGVAFIVAWVLLGIGIYRQSAQQH